MSYANSYAQSIGLELDSTATECWDNPITANSRRNGLSDHTGIVQKVENGIVYTVEGNSGDSVRVNPYPVGHYEILGYGVPQY